MSDSLMTQLRESLLLERARKIVRIAQWDNEDSVGAVADILRIIRDEGIAVGLDQATRHATQIENGKAA